MSSKKSRDKRLQIAKDMPKLKRAKTGEKYSYKNDKVFEWISKRPFLLNYVFDKLVQAGYIVYDNQTGYWQGINFEEDEIND